jgi:hypothetical protein
MFSGRHEEARRRLQRAIDLDPNCAFAHMYIGVSHAFVGERDLVLRHCDEAMRLSPRDPLLIPLLFAQGMGGAKCRTLRNFGEKIAIGNPFRADCWLSLATSKRFSAYSAGR